MQMLVVASNGLYCFGRLGHEVHHSAIRPRAFPLGLLAPRCLGAPLFRPTLGCCLGGAGVALVWGEEGILPPAPPHPRSFGFRRRTTPLLVFKSCCRGVASATGFSIANEGRRSPVGQDARRGNARGLKSKSCTCPTRVSVAALPPVRAPTPPTSPACCRTASGAPCYIYDFGVASFFSTPIFWNLSL